MQLACASVPQEPSGSDETKGVLSSLTLRPEENVQISGAERFVPPAAAGGGSPGPDWTFRPNNIRI